MYFLQHRITQESGILKFRKKKLCLNWCTREVWSHLGIQTFQPKAKSNFWSLTLKAGLPWSWTFGPSACEGKEEHLWTCVLYLPRKVCLSRSSSLQVRTEAEDRWMFGNHRQKSQLNCCCGLTPGVINQLLALCWDLVGVTHMGWCLSKEKSTSGNGQWYVKKVGLYRSCPCFPGLAQEKGKFF